MSDPSPRYVAFLEDILDAAERAIQFTRDWSYSQFKADDRSHYATVRALEIIGEAAKRVPEEIREKYPQIAWSEMSRMRDKLIHHYTKVNLEVVWRTTREDLPVLIDQIREVLNQLSDSD
jgi:uncharacterized protein with HEPN domain